MTKEISVESVFSSISYLNEANIWVTMNPGDQKNFQIETFYVSSRKCFSFKVEFHYDRNSLFQPDGNQVLKVNFSQSFVAERSPQLMTRIKNTMQFSKIVELSYKTTDDPQWSPSFSLQQEFRREIYRDRFERIKSPLSIFCPQTPVNDVDAYVHKLASDFTRKYNKTTLNLPLERAQFGLPINDTLFEKYFVDEQNVTDHRAPVTKSYDRQYAVNHLRKSFKTNRPDFEYGLVHLKRVTIMTTSYSYGTLLLELLLAASLWFNLSPLGLFRTISDSVDHFQSKDTS